ncbi:MAG TPA: hypothetical protein H9799_00350 [Candidatus Mediterraneibacter merdipullorum]|nr:hypothetical protein [Candidatus Mediterraneibacter merdipullorum]
MKKKTKEKKSREHILSREERILFYISEKDIWKQGKTVNPVIKRLGEKGPVYDDGVHVIYVNAEVNDGSRIAKLMEYFKTADPEDDSEGELSKRVHYLKRENQMGMSPEQISRAVGEDISAVKKWLAAGQEAR